MILDDGEKVRLTYTKGPLKFRDLNAIARDIGEESTYIIRNLLGLSDYSGHISDYVQGAPSWARGADMSDGKNLASKDHHDQVVVRFIEERSKFSRPANLEFKVSTSGELWVKWERG